jgi:hypothetical protein
MSANAVGAAFRPVFSFLDVKNDSVMRYPRYGIADALRQSRAQSPDRENKNCSKQNSSHELSFQLFSKESFLLETPHVRLVSRPVLNGSEGCISRTQSRFAFVSGFYGVF